MPTRTSKKPDNYFLLLGYNGAGHLCLLQLLQHSKYECTVYRFRVTQYQQAPGIVMGRPTPSNRDTRQLPKAQREVLPDENSSNDAGRPLIAVVGARLYRYYLGAPTRTAMNK